MEREGTLRTHELASLRDYFLVVRRRKWIALQAIVLVPLIAVILSMRQQPEYQASAEVLLQSQNLALSLTGANDPLSNGTPDRLAETQSRLARVPLIAQRVLRRAELTDRSAEQFLARSSVSDRQNADLLTFAVTDADPEVAITLATLYAQEYVRYRRDLDTASITRARRDVEAEMNRLEAQNERATPLYANLADKHQQLRTIEALQTNNSSVVREASSAAQTAPRTKRNVVLGVVLGLILGLGLVFLWEALDTRVRSTDEIERILGLPLVSRIPAPPRPLQRSNTLVMTASPHSPEAEAYRILRTNFDFFNLQRDARVVMVTSAVSQEGKSTTIGNLAIALARAGQRVVLVDLDLRRPILDRFFKLETSPGVTDVALGKARLDAVALGPSEDGDESHVGALHVLTAGTMLSDAGEFVASAALSNTLDLLRGKSDVVLIDAPPMLLVGDALQLSAKVDAVLVVTRLGVVRRQMLVDLRRILDTSPAEKLGFVVTGAEREPEYRYGYGYGPYAYVARPGERKASR